MSVLQDFLDGLEAGGYWDEWCLTCDRTTPHPEGPCKICGDKS